MNWNEPKVFAVKHKENKIRMASRSGGIFTALSDKILSQKGVIYGCVLTEKFEAVHIRAENSENRDNMRGSKYIQSNLQDVFKSVLKDLNAEKMVLFSGTSCQISGLKNFLGKEYTNLVCIDIVCHGVPSPLIWREYLRWQEQKNKGTCIGVDFRNKKKYGWTDHVETLEIQRKNKQIVDVDSRVFTTLFYEHSILRPSCYKCPYKAIMHPGDITIADYWGVEKAAPGFSDNKGVSLVLVNNEKGMELFHNITKHIEYRVTNIEDSLQEPLIHPFSMPENRNKFWKEYKNNSFEMIAKKYGGYGWKNTIKRFVGKVIRKIRRV